MRHTILNGQGVELVVVYIGRVLFLVVSGQSNRAVCFEIMAFVYLVMAYPKVQQKN